MRPPRGVLLHDAQSEALRSASVAPLLEGVGAGSFGAAYAAFLRRHAFDPDERSAVQFVDDAELAYLGALKIDEDDAKASGNLAAVYLKKKNWAQAFTLITSGPRV